MIIRYLSNISDMKKLVIAHKLLRCGLVNTRIISANIMRYINLKYGCLFIHLNDLIISLYLCANIIIARICGHLLNEKPPTFSTSQHPMVTRSVRICF